MMVGVSSSPPPSPPIVGILLMCLPSPLPPANEPHLPHPSSSATASTVHQERKKRKTSPRESDFPISGGGRRRGLKTNPPRLPLGRKRGCGGRKRSNGELQNRLPDCKERKGEIRPLRTKLTSGFDLEFHANMIVLYLSMYQSAYWAIYTSGK